MPLRYPGVQEGRGRRPGPDAGVREQEAARESKARPLFVAMWAKKRWQWPVVAVAFVLALSAMVGARRVLTQHREGPVVGQVRAIPGVEDVWIDQDAGSRAMWVQLGPVDDLAGLVDALRRAAGSGHLGVIDRIVLLDGRSVELERALRQLSLPLHEGASSGAFTAMSDRVRQQAASLGVEVDGLYVDHVAVYVALRQQEAYLYEVIPRVLPASDGGPGSNSIPVRVATTFEGAGPAPAPGEQAASLRGEQGGSR